MFKANAVFIILIFALAACSPINITGSVTDGEEVVTTSMTAQKHMFETVFDLETELPDGRIYKGELEIKNPSAVLFSADGNSMKCDFTFNDKSKNFEKGGKAACTTSQYQKLDINF